MQNVKKFTGKDFILVDGLYYEAPRKLTGPNDNPYMFFETEFFPVYIRRDGVSFYSTSFDYNKMTYPPKNLSSSDITCLISIAEIFDRFRDIGGFIHFPSIADKIRENSIMNRLQDKIKERFNQDELIKNQRIVFAYSKDSQE